MKDDNCHVFGIWEWMEISSLRIPK